MSNRTIYVTAHINTSPSYCACSGRGLCIDNGGILLCLCDQGFTGMNQFNLPTCDTTLLDVNSVGFNAFRSIHIILGILAILYALLNIFYYNRVVLKSSSRSIEQNMIPHYTAMKATIGTTSNVILWTLICWITLNTLVWIIDPMSYYYIMPYWLYRLFSDCGTTAASICTLAIFEHVIKFTSYSLTLLNRSELVRRINSNYLKDLTVEDMIVETSKKRSILRLNAIVNVPLFCIQVSLSITHALFHRSYLTIALIHITIIGVLFMAYSIATYFIWRNYVSIFPNDVRPKMTIRVIFIKLCIACLTTLLNIVLSTMVFNLDTSWLSFYHYEGVFIVLQYTSVFCMISIFNPPKIRHYLRMRGYRGSTDPSLNAIQMEAPRMPTTERGSNKVIEMDDSTMCQISPGKMEVVS